jgi:hypothetical protein
MYKWEYTVVRVFGGVVMMEDGQEVGNMVNNQPVGEMFYEYLDRVGEQGWELIGIAGVREGLEAVLKRPSNEGRLETQEE